MPLGSNAIAIDTALAAIVDALENRPASLVKVALHHAAVTVILVASQLCGQLTNKVKIAR